MSQPTATPAPGGVIARLSARISHRQQQALDRVHAAGDARAREHSWTITTRPGALSLGARVYRDPRFAARQPGAPAEAAAMKAGRPR